MAKLSQDELIIAAMQDLENDINTQREYAIHSPRFRDGKGKQGRLRLDVALEDEAWLAKWREAHSNGLLKLDPYGYPVIRE